MAQVNYIPNAILSAATIESGYSLDNLKTGMTSYYRTSALTDPQWLVANLGGSILINDFAFFNHNISSNASIILQANISNVWIVPTFSQALTWSNKKIIDTSLSQTYQFWRMQISDVSNVDGYIKGSFWFLGTGLTDVTTGPAFTVIDPNDRFGDIRISWNPTT